MRPENLSIKELVFYGQDHNDPWVRHLTTLLFDVINNLPEEYLRYNNTVENWLVDHNDTVYQLEHDLECAEETANELQQEIDSLTQLNRALRFDLEENFKRARENSQITGLKSALVELQEQYDRDKKYHGSVVSELEKLQKAHKELSDKYNTWHIIAT
jgi:chromosome segregation ATPase